jgi:quinolinate synthase
MLKYPGQTDAGGFIVGTETGMLYRLKNLYPDKAFYPVSEKAVCPNMKMITTEKVLAALQEMTPVVKVPESIREKAHLPVQRMLEIV